MRLGFTGTQRGMTRPQLAAVASWLWDHALDISGAHHGDCIGADEQFDGQLDVFCITTVIHPPIVAAKRAFCLSKRKGAGAVWETPPAEYLARNRHIVDGTDRLIATPGEMTEQLRSGTWSTVRYARRLKHPIRIFWPDGSTSLDARVSP
jgi:hypothetical protein